VREALGAGALPAPEAVDVQRLVDRLAPTPDAPAEGGVTLQAAASVLPAPWNASARLVVVAVRAAAPVEGAELSVDGAAALGGPDGPLPLGALEAGGSAVRVFLVAGGGPSGPVRLRWTDPLSGQRREAKLPAAEGPVPPEAQAAAAVAGWALLLRDGEGRLGDWGPGEAAALAESAQGLGAEAIELMRRSEDLAR
jgi:hypothetical protein